MGLEEQQEEREVLESIFPDEITDISENEFRVLIVLDVERHEDDETEQPELLLQVTYPEAYPDEAPRLDIQSPPNAPKYPHFDVQEDKEQLLQNLYPIIEESMGMAMIFTIISTLKELAEQLILDRQKVEELERETEAQKVEEEENRKFHGSAVTRESFMAWRAKFKQELEEEERIRQEEALVDSKGRKIAKEEPRITGRQLWERGLVGKIDEDEGDDEVEQMEKLKVEA
ncbi:RWD-domain-containing protein [Eremomyces bilateralis CBS 781.70]|uniref:RWD-domain-containing protein n=1 Tax=Eremomyces bilateralis CBS 781.70 TaxID=1392243 RepID=A0A6G1GH49_9PEZI|nr:RWD-domain-containing protein [Eremomyces bilateralis CBS 781.70]KAF1817190.1 RWD-domain-containing protein [Eremomyces bilateralis CBS 781.70]